MECFRWCVVPLGLCLVEIRQYGANEPVLRFNEYDATGRVKAWIELNNDNWIALQDAFIAPSTRLVNQAKAEFCGPDLIVTLNIEGQFEKTSITCSDCQLGNGIRTEISEGHLVIVEYAAIHGKLEQTSRKIKLTACGIEMLLDYMPIINHFMPSKL